ncbi:sensor histidine kinase [Pontibacter pamirensis]|uniref:sensor histidine kinase n=1 Tax=Pontibacter pamirensis TaxID=2562824 RepID=UPI001F46FCE1|nr:ATP-binding protein [Pontibacter pamirensis]
MIEQEEKLQWRIAELEKRLAENTRELEIEAALERVRARAMDMHHTFELSDVLSVLFEQYDILGIYPVFSHLTLFDVKNNRFSFRTTGRGGQRVQAEQQIDIDAIDAWKESVENWKKGGPNQVNSHVYPKEILPQVFQLFHDILSVIPAAARYYPEDFPDGLFITQGYCTFGYVGFGHNRPATEEEKGVVRKIAVEFERLYQRFIDLQRAEVQIREAQIEASLERLRARTMAMHSSDAVGNATGVLFSELDKLGIPLLRCGLIIIDEKAKTMQVWRATTTQDGTIGQATGNVSMTIHPMLEAAYHAWIRKEPVFRYDLSGDDVVNYYKALSNNASQFTQSVTVEKQSSTSFYFNEGALFTFSKEPLDAEACAVLSRFAAVVSLTYRRYLDLRTAEAQAREAVKQASLDRVRAETASMRTARDLEKITPLIWNELTVLGVPFIRCGVFIMDNLRQVSHTYLSTPDGKAVAAFDLPYDAPGNIAQIVLHWKNKKTYSEFWDEEAYTAFGSALVDRGIFTSKKQYLSTLPGGGFFIHFTPFLQGMLYVGNTALLGEEEMKLIQSLADAFSTAYARYEDFSKLEAAKQQVDRTLLDLKQAQQQLIQAEKMASLGQLTAGIAHEIQNPLNFINNFSDVNTDLIAEMKDEISKSHYDEVKVIADLLVENEKKINYHGQRADAIVKGMLQHTGTHRGKKELTNINSLCDEYVRLSYHGLRAKDKTFSIEIKTDFDESLDRIYVIPQDIGRVFLNLFNNAFYAVNEKRQKLRETYKPIVMVTTTKENGKAIIKVTDNGPGIPQGILDRIFQPFFTTKPTGQGTGLGLSMSYDIIKAHDGAIKVETKEGEGSVFVIELPIKTT